MSHDQVLQKVGEIQALHPDWDPNDIYEALCVTNFNNAQAILKLMIQEEFFEFWRDLSHPFSPRILDKSRKSTIEPVPRQNESESPFAAVGIIQQQYYKECEKRDGTIVDYFDRSNNGGNNRNNYDDNGFPSDEENYYDDDFQNTEKNNTSTISSPKKNSNQPNLQRSRDNRPQNHVVQTQYAYTAKEKPAKRPSAAQSQISSHFKSSNSDATNNPQTSYKSQYSYFGSGFTLRSKSNVHSKVENSSRKRKRSKFLDDFWNSDEEDLEDVHAHNSSYNSDSDNSSINKHRKKSPAEKIQTFKSKYFQQKSSHEQSPSDKIDKTNDQNGEQYQEEIIQNDYEENYQYDEPTNQHSAFTSSHNEQQDHAEKYENEHDLIDGNNEESHHYDQHDALVEGQHYDEEMPEEHRYTRHDVKQNSYQEQMAHEEEYFADNNRNNHNENRHDHFKKEIDAKIDVDEEGPSLFIPTIFVDSETPDPIVVSDSDSSQLTTPTTNSSVNSNNPILIDSSPIRSHSSTAEKKKNDNNKKNSNDVQITGANRSNIESLDDEMAYFEKIKNATANKRRKIILD